MTPTADARDVTELLVAWGAGDEGALHRLLPIVHAELVRAAACRLRDERPDHTLQPAALVNEAYLRLVEIDRIRWQNRTHFFAMAARLMRRVLVDHARAHRSQKRGGGVHRTAFDESLLLPGRERDDLLSLHEALEALEKTDLRKSEVVALRFFGGLSVAETAEALGISEETVIRDWKFAKVWLLRELDRRRD
jgi:RNA polymerase sigma factor (TIGR02999 family)